MKNRRWQAEFNQLLIERDRLEAQAHEATVTKAREEIDQFYEDYNKKREKVLQESRARQTQKLQDEVTGTFWEKVCKYIDLEEGKKGTKDVSRFQQLLGQLKYSKEEKV
ncbi:hypothetical protein HMI56_006738 [Coelomomyces lativittatus]|nr:hypothetical protein HMI56_006738 [Coelomomyces lativittatus]